MRGRVDVIQLLIGACSTSIQIKSQYDQQTVFHLCVNYNQLEALKLLIMRGTVDAEFLNSADKDGNTILQLAMTMKPVETIKYLVSIPEVTVEADNLDMMFTNPLGFDGMSVQEHCSIGEPISMRIKRPTDYRDATSPQPQAQVYNAQPAISNDLQRYLEHQANWMEKTRGNLMVVATVIASMAFQAAINPPGGVWQDGQSTSCPNGKQCKIGTAVLSSTDELKYNIFIASNTISFSASLTIIFLLLCGFTLRIKAALFIWLLAMCTAILFIAGAYITSVSLVGNPDDNSTIGSGYNLYIMFWVGLLAFIIVFQTVSFVFWVLMKLLLGAFHVIRCPFQLRCHVPRGGPAIERSTSGV